MSDGERQAGDREAGEAGPVCPVCGARVRSGDRFCAACGSPLASSPDQSPPGAVSTSPAADVAPTDSAKPAPKPEREPPAWVFGARPAMVIGGGVLLLLLAAALLAIGQLDDTGTIVMLSICLAPLGFLILAIGVARQLARVMDGK